MPGATTLLELGSGTSAKTRLLLETFTNGGRSIQFVPIDVSATVLAESAEIIARVSPDTPAKVGQKLKLAATTEKLHAFDQQTEKAIGLN